MPGSIRALNTNLAERKSDYVPIGDSHCQVDPTHTEWGHNLGILNE